ncbi:MAG: hypothetical protein H0T78_10410 [Longispora sp.]|nr:hypothetical protein [Longispora sp. (in: high G+C Gram-positive bacteria)]
MTTPLGIRARISLTITVATLLLVGSFLGEDDAFPFGPFRMYSTTDALDSPVRDTRVEATDTGGRVFELTEVNTGFRRAEVEGQLGRFERDPGLLGHLATAYTSRNPGASTIARISIVARWHELAGGRPTGASREETILTWKRN